MKQKLFDTHVGDAGAVFAALCKEKLAGVEVFNIADDSLVKGIREAGSSRRRFHGAWRVISNRELAGADYICNVLVDWARWRRAGS